MKVENTKYSFHPLGGIDRKRIILIKSSKGKDTCTNTKNLRKGIPFLEFCHVTCCLHHELETYIEFRSPQRINLYVVRSSRFSDSWYAYFYKVKGTIHYIDSLGSIRDLFLFYESNFTGMAFLQCSL